MDEDCLYLNIYTPTVIFKNHITVLLDIIVIFLCYYFNPISLEKGLNICFIFQVQSKTSQLFPVMFYIHGGEFEHGSGNEFPGHQLAHGGQVVSWNSND